MANKQNQTSSFVLRFTQKIFKDDNGESNVQWRGKITHVQDDEALNFSEMKDAMAFMQSKLSDLTLSSIDGKSEEEKEGILTKSFDIWKKMATQYPKFVMQAIKDPKTGVTQIQEQISQVGDEISQKIELDSYKPATKSDLKTMMDMMETMNKQINALGKKVDKLSKNKKSK